MKKLVGTKRRKNTTLKDTLFRANYTRKKIKAAQYYK